MAGRSVASAPFPAVKYVKQLQPDHKVNSWAVTVNIGAQQGIDAHNVGRNLVAGLSYFKGGGLEIEEPGGKRLLPLDGDHTHQLFDPKMKHSTKPWYGGTRVVLVAYSARDSGKLKQDKVDCLKYFGVGWVSRFSMPAEEEHVATLSTLRVDLLDAKEGNVSEQHRDSPEQEGTGGGVLDGDVPSVHPSPKVAGSDDHPGVSDAFESLSYLTKDVELATRDLKDRAVRLRDLLEEEEIICEDYRRLGQTTRETQGDEVHENLLGLERLRTLTCLKAARESSASTSSDEINYEEMLDNLEI